MHFLASIPSPETSSIEIGPFTVYFYALFILSGIVIATLLQMQGSGPEELPRVFFLTSRYWRCQWGSWAAGSSM